MTLFQLLKRDAQKSIICVFMRHVLWESLLCVFFSFPLPLCVYPIRSMRMIFVPICVGISVIFLLFLVYYITFWNCKLQSHWRWNRLSKYNGTMRAHILLQLPNETAMSVRRNAFFSLENVDWVNVGWLNKSLKWKESTSGKCQVWKKNANYAGHHHRFVTHNSGYT